MNIDINAELRGRGHAGTPPPPLVLLTVRRGQVGKSCKILRKGQAAALRKPQRSPTPFPQPASLDFRRLLCCAPDGFEALLRIERQLCCLPWIRNRPGKAS